MKKKIKLASGILACSLAVTAAASCGTVSGGDSVTPESPQESVFHGYDESKRVEDTRTITDQEYTVLNIAGTDDYGRSIVTVDGKKDNEKYVGMFFFLTLGQHANHKGIYDISKTCKFFFRFYGIVTRIIPIGINGYFSEFFFFRTENAESVIIMMPRCGNKVVFI